MRSMRSTLLLAGLLAIAPLISATPASSRPPRKVQHVGSPISSLVGLIGCFTDSPEGSSLPFPMTPTGGPGENSVLNCLSACQGWGYLIAGVEAGTKCFCGPTGIKVGGTQVDSGECKVLTCPGNAEDYCGAENRIFVFEAAD